MRKLGIIILILMLAVTGGCAKSGSSANQSKNEASAAADYGAAEDSLSGGEKNEVAKLDTESSGISDTAVASEADAAASNADILSEEGTSGNAQDVENGAKKLIITYNIQGETTGYEEFKSKLETAISASGGYTESMNEYQDSADSKTYHTESEEEYQVGRRHISYTIRIPNDKAKDVSSDIKDMINVLSHSENATDVTLTYVDTESRIKALKAEQETLMKLMEDASSMEEIIAIQTQLTQIRYELESYESQMRSLENQISYSTIYLNVSEVEREKAVDGSFGNRLKTTFLNSLDAVGSGLTTFAVGFIGGLPIWLILAAIVFVIILIVRKIDKNARRKREERMRMYQGGVRQQNTTNTAAKQKEPDDTKRP